MMHVNRLRACQAAACVLISVILFGCATPEPPVSTVTELSEAARTSLTEAIQVRMLASACEKLGGDIALQATDTHRSWLSRNWQWVAVSDQFYSNALKSQVLTYRSQEVALPALKFLAEQEIEAIRTLGFSTRSQVNRAKSCEKKLAPYASAEKDLASSDPARKLALETLLQRYGKQSEDIHRVPRLAGNLDPHSEPGRMQYTVEQSLREKLCTDPVLLTFKNDWPLEAYGAFCSNEKQFFIACEWGKCNFKAISEPQGNF